LICDKEVFVALFDARSNSRVYFWPLREKNGLISPLHYPNSKKLTLDVIL